MTNSNPDGAFDGVEVVYAKSWGSKAFYGAPDKDIGERAQYRGKWIVDEAKMARTNSAIFMHCLPAHRGQEIDDATLEANAQTIFDQSENRLHVQKAVLLAVAA